MPSRQNMRGTNLAQRASKRIEIIEISESEYMSQAMYFKQSQWATQIFRDLGMPGYVSETVQMFGDNQGAIG